MTQQKQRVLITGGTGLIGTRLRQFLPADQYELAVLSRNPSRSTQRAFQWDLEKGYLDPEAIEFADTIVHLAGEPIAGGRWTQKQKKKIMESRIKSGELLTKCIRQARQKPDRFISASAIGYYGAVTSQKIFDETDPPGDDFVSKVVKNWERSTKGIAEMGIPNYLIRISNVLDPEGGVLKKMALPVSLGIGSPLGSGRQWMPWISMRDLVRLIRFIIEEDIDPGVYNAATPQHVNNSIFLRQLAESMNRPFFFPKVPAFVLSILFGEMATIILHGSRVSSKKLIDAGFVFEDVELRDTLHNYFGS